MEDKIQRLFIHTETFTSTGPNYSDLPLLSSLPTDIQDSINRYVRIQDRQMSLASALLKYYFIHRNARILWKEVVISRTPDPHRRPYWDASTAPSATRNESDVQLEFNASHQAGLVGLIGCILPPGSSPPLIPGSSRVERKNNGSSFASINSAHPQPEPTPLPTSASPDSNTGIRLGLDITCANEPGRGAHSTVNNTRELYEWISIFSEVFSPADLSHMKHAPLNPSPPPGTAEHDVVMLKLRRFYTFFALKEAFVKMTGEALLANWLREVEFRNVKVPAEADEEGSWGTEIDTDTEVWLHGRKLEEVKMEIRAWGKSFIVATAIDGSESPTSHAPTEQWRFLDWSQTIAPCALGTCNCLS